MQSKSSHKHKINSSQKDYLKTACTKYIFIMKAESNINEI